MGLYIQSNIMNDYTNVLDKMKNKASKYDEVMQEPCSSVCVSKLKTGVLA